MRVVTLTSTITLNDEPDAEDQCVLSSSDRIIPGKALGYAAVHFLTEFAVLREKNDGVDFDTTIKEVCEHSKTLREARERQTCALPS